MANDMRTRLNRFYNWHKPASYNRMKPQPLGNAWPLQVEKYGYGDGLELKFSDDAGEQISFFIDHDLVGNLKAGIQKYFPDDEVTRLRIAMTCIAGLAKRIGTDTGIPFYNEVIQAILDTAKSWPQLAGIAVDLAAKDAEIAQLKKQVSDMQDAAAQLKGIEAWITDKDMKRHCNTVLDKLTK
jgi:hypothetical protein